MSHGGILNHIARRPGRWENTSHQYPVLHRNEPIVRTSMLSRGGKNTGSRNTPLNQSTRAASKCRVMLAEVQAEMGSDSASISGIGYLQAFSHLLNFSLYLGNAFAPRRLCKDWPKQAACNRRTLTTESQDSQHDSRSESVACQVYQRYRASRQTRRETS